MSLLEMWSPVTYDFGLIHAPVDVVSARYLAWQVELGRRVAANSANGEPHQTLTLKVKHVPRRSDSTSSSVPEQGRDDQSGGE
jgi:hypothetical protein